MTPTLETPHKKYVSSVKPEDESVSILEVVGLMGAYIIKKMSLQTGLMISSFLTYGLGDGVTAAYMMEKVGIVRESNPVARLLYVSYGHSGMVAMKLWFTMVILSIVWVISKRKGAYWTVNGFLFALTIGGIMAMRANLLAAHGMAHPSPGSIITVFLIMVILFINIGDLIDRMNSNANYRRVM